MTEIVKMMHSENQKDAENARGVVMEMGDLALAPMLDNLTPDKPHDFVWDLQQIATFQLENRARIVRWLDDMLLDKKILPPLTISLEAEEKPPPMRMCDHAYLLMRQLFALEDEETELINKDLYLDFSDDERDQEIKRATQSKKWISLLELE
jgi:hypothetical protein